MSTKSQITFNKKQKEKLKAQKKKLKLEKRESKKKQNKTGLEINWAIAPKNNTLTPIEKELKESNRLNHLSKS
ncbi:hypothetical protein TPENAI_50271 [Tenacibaculum litopenaei]|jgi:hypothetical protein|uniref:hypothetical protein n=1 Tax=Tenacibaculum litopenaei TaxID=396016 RepID=UPI00389500E8